jgi:hypothetical protein
MNTYDVRNMSTKQWVFWATAIPLTVLIIVTCLVWAGEFGSARAALGKLVTGKKGKVGNAYTVIPDEFGMVGERAAVLRAQTLGPGRFQTERERERERDPYVLEERVIVPQRVRRSHTLYGGRERVVDYA